MKRFFLIGVCSFLIGSVYSQNVIAINDYINTYKDLAIAEEIRAGVPAAITLAQGILETNAGQCDLLKASNNHFGIKCKSDWTGNTVYHDDDARGECFRSYDCAADSYRDHSDFLKQRPNYAFLFNLDPTDYEGWAMGLKKAGYATNPVYAATLIKYIVTYHLQNYTLLALQRSESGTNQPQLASAAVSQNSANTTLPKADEEETEAPKSAPITAKVVQTTITAPSVLYPAGVFSINGTRAVYAQQGTSLFALASKYNISYGKLLEYNEMTGNEEDKNRLVYLGKKSKKGSKTYHVVTVEETLPDIARTEGVRLESLEEYNSLQKDVVLHAGQKIYLQDTPPYMEK